MKTTRLVVPVTATREATSATLQTQRALQLALKEEYFRRELSAGRAFYEGAVTEVKAGDGYMMRFPVGASTHAAIQFEAREQWARTRPRLHVWYTSPVGSTNTFTMRWVLRSFPVGSTVTGSVFVVDITPPGPAVANTELYATAVGTAIFPAVRAPMQFRLGRIAGDANANALDIVLAVTAFEEVT